MIETTEVGLELETVPLPHDVTHVRWAPAPTVDLERELERRLHERQHLLVALPDVDDALGQARFAERVARVLGSRGAIELDSAARPRSIWTLRAGAGDVARELFEAARLARATGSVVAWRVGADHAEPEHVEVLRRRDLLVDGDAMLIDAAGRTPAELEQMLLRLDPVLPRSGVWLRSGLDPRMPGAAVRELAAWHDARALGPARLYWVALPDGPVARILDRVGLGAALRLGTPRVVTDAAPRKRVLVTGGAGFVGSNLVATLVRRGHHVVVLDDLRRAGVELNLASLAVEHRDGVEVVLGDVRCPATVRRALQGVQQVFHLAGQVAVTSSLDDPVEDFDINARGTLVVLEEMRRMASPPGLVFTSTNKVYGNLAELELEEHATRWAPSDPHVRSRGIDERQPLALHSPYGCSKGSGDQYVLDYAASFGIAAVVFRMSCIYGPRQFGNEDQGWVAHFLKAALEGEPLTIYGDGKQVRDILFVGDLVNAFMLAAEHVERLRGRAFNIGGGPENTVSLLELLGRIETLLGRRPQFEFARWRRGDQRYYVSDTTRFRAETGWKIGVGVEPGLACLLEWLRGLVGTGVAATQPTAAAVEG